MTHPVLYNCPPSGNCYKVRLFAALAGIPLQIRNVDLIAGEQKQPWFRELNPWQHVPVLQDGDTVIWDSQAILVYLAEKYQKTDWWPSAPGARARVVEWLSVSVNEIQHGPADARLVKLFGYPLRYEDAVAASARVLPTINEQLSARNWLAGDRPTLADCAAYPYLFLAPQGGVSLAPYTALEAWMERMEALPGYISVEK
ncbi:glutathione S-transferase family protein [Acetobacter conturbans]|uniref:Glutathione S-transferase n=1 Tax=Acetobacter conturbans TaxID=1737472 RepID=A0ABX0JXF5_9PROT|nr:glutathione S-transferase [Acetobacter conturbans]NHN87971.1 glutathione S-transferase [Acetobacter conturbans]